MKSNPLSATTVVHALAWEHAPALQVLASHPAVAATTRLPHPYPDGGAEAFVAAQLKESAEGRSHVFVVKHRGEVAGVCGLHGIANDAVQELGYWIGQPFWGRGFATFAVQHALEFAFDQLNLQHVGAVALESNTASRRVLIKTGFQFVRLDPSGDPLLKRPREPLAVHAITRSRWVEFTNAATFAAFHPALLQLLRAELAAGNELRETGAGWPDPDSLLVRLRFPFRAMPALLPLDVNYSEPRDPHWWSAEYNSRSPRHILAAG